MGTISDKLMRIINTKEDIRQALISKGYDVPTSIPFKEYAKMILDLPCKADSFPDIEGIVARYYASGLTNEQMAANPVWVDKTGNGHDLQMKNFAWGGMSGVGGYEMNFNLWTNNVPSIPDISMSTTTTSVSVSVGNSTYNNNLIYIHISNWDINKNHWLKVTSTYEDGDLAFIFYNDSNTKKIGLPANGYVNIPAYPEFKGNYMYISTTSNKQGSFTIEQFPLYPGALVFDGVDDYGVCENFPILTKEKGYTVVALRQWITRGEGSLGLVSNVKNWNNNGAFLLEYRNIQADHFNKPISFGAIGSENDLPHILTYQTSKSYNGVSITTGNFEGTDVLHVGKLAPTNVGTCINAAIWELVFLDHDATEEELTKIKDYFVKTYPWLFPDQAWTVTGKTNEDEDRATIANITGNGNDLILSNFGFAEGSGYGLYQQNYAIWTKVSNRATFTVTSSKIHVTSVTAEEHADFIYTTGQQLKQKIRITGLPEGASFVIGRSGVDLKIISQDGIYDVDILDDSSANPIIGYRINRILDSCDITIEQIPEYEGYLITDGVDDEVRSAAFTLNEDWTIVGNWEFITNENKNAGLTKVYSFYLYNRDYGIFVYKYINAGQGFSVEDVKSLKAICSDGRIYLNDWQEIRNNIEQEATISKGVMAIGYFNRDFTKVAFKNLGIYNDQLLSKDDCIKAYNYLQTLKSK
jgi:hypothetical protein